MVVISNNPLIKELICVDNIKILYRNVSILELFKESLTFSYDGYTLLNHPLHANWQMNQTPYKSLLFECRMKSEYNTVYYLNLGIEWAESLEQYKLLPDKWPKNCLKDLQELDKETVMNYFTKNF